MKLKKRKIKKKQEKVHRKREKDTEGGKKKKD